VIFLAFLLATQGLLAAGLSDEVAVAGVAFIVGQGVAIWGVLKILAARDERHMAVMQQWTNALLEAHTSGKAISDSNLVVVRELKKLTRAKGIA